MDKTFLLVAGWSVLGAAAAVLYSSEINESKLRPPQIDSEYNVFESSVKPKKLGL